MKKIIIGLLLIGIVTLVNFYSDEIIYYYKIISIKNSYEDIKNNQYSLNYNFNFVKQKESLEIKNKEESKNFLYTLLNSGTNSLKNYCNINYKKCIEDVKEIASDENLLASINDYIHPFNSFSNITFSIDNSISVEANVTRVYDDEKIDAINKKVDEVMKDIVKETNTSRENIKAIHDYIIKNTKYDVLKTQNIKDQTYQSSNAYGVLIEGQGTCSGYADTLAIFMNKLNIPNYKISNETHVWNLIYIDSKWLHIDLTWDDPITNTGTNITKYDYFLITTDELKNLNDEEHDFDINVYSEAIN